MNQTPLLLRYKVHDCYNGVEDGFDPNTGLFIGEETEYEVAKHELWFLQMPDQRFFLTDDGEPPCFRRWEYYVVGDQNPIIVYFRNVSYPQSNEVQIYPLPGNYTAYYHSADIDYRKFQSVFHDFERCRGDWETRVIVVCD